MLLFCVPGICVTLADSSLRFLPQGQTSPGGFSQRSLPRTPQSAGGGGLDGDVSYHQAVLSERERDVHVRQEARRESDFVAEKQKEVASIRARVAEEERLKARDQAELAAMDQAVAQDNAQDLRSSVFGGDTSIRSITQPFHMSPGLVGLGLAGTLSPQPWHAGNALDAAVKPSYMADSIASKDDFLSFLDRFQTETDTMLDNAKQA